MIIQNTLERGKSTENQALNFLENRGLIFIENNFRCKCGEIDIVMRDANVIVFVEVRFRRNNRYGSGAETVGRKKQQKIIASASYYLQRNKKLARQPCRFDVISMSPGNIVSSSNNIDWIANAFTA
jgi:putative endonuclease